ncbi:hypothetical protein A3754_10460 [Alcanivorax sp. HI0083]|uniref:DUF2167 domain-containing protein n=1 Tax=unclassified Alcanivorax TaxID=2638842 RepID=UPI0007B79349|nr:MULTISPECIES: DUF2167 domain-containing protein [unclassified Alcanivorax]KZY35031.1 hypothetical protein A3730_15455 [Alcanivorax sp. HI0044]KZZ26643.1 hypothetical protein A3754_10460 [Alcanivorax sp. HI0083]
MNAWSHAAGCVLLIASTAIHANTTEHTQQEEPKTLTEAEMLQQYQEYVEHLWQGMSPQQGRITLDGAGAVLEVPDDFYYLDSEDARVVLEDMWGNPPDQNTLGMLFPANYQPFDEQAWGVDIAYVEEGHVDDEDASSIDYSDLLSDMQDSLEEENKYRQEQDYPTIKLVGWAEQPHYDEQQHQLYWAKQLRFEDTEGDTLNYNIRKLGREGFLQMNFIAGMQSLPEINQRLDQVLAMSSFTDGNRYADFNPDTDHMAAYGIGGLIAGKVLAKTGFFAVALLLLKKFWFVIIAGVLAAGKTLFRKK